MRRHVRSRKPIDGWCCRIKCLSERQVARIPRQANAHPVRDVCVSDLRFRIGQPQRTPGARVPKSTGVTERPSSTWLHESERELSFTFHALVEETVLRGEGRSG